MLKRQQANLNFHDNEIKTLLQLFPKGVVAIDFEMTGLSPVFDKIIEIAGVKITPNKEVTVYHSLINPLIEIPEYTKQYHGLENKDLRESPSIKQPLRDFIGFYGDLPIVAHSAMFDASFLIKAIHENSLDIGLSDVLDSCRLARSFFKKKTERPENFKLSTLAEYFKLDFSHHQAIDDAFVSLKIFAKICQEISISERASLMRNYSYLFKLKDFKKREHYALPKKLEELRENLQTKTPMEIMYSGGQYKNEFRPVRPIALLPLPQGLMLYAECLKDNMNKYFQTKKIKKIRDIS